MRLNDETMIHNSDDSNPYDVTEMPCSSGSGLHIDMYKGIGYKARLSKIEAQLRTPVKRKK